MPRSGGLAAVALGLMFLWLFLAYASAGTTPSPPGLDPDEDAAFRLKHRRGPSLWKPAYLWGLRKLRDKWRRVAPVHLYRRTCGNGAPTRQVIVRMGECDLDAILKDDASHIAFLLHVRWILEAYWRLVVPVYRLEPKLLLILDFEGVSCRTAVSNTMRIKSLIGKVNDAFRGLTGRGWSGAFLLNPPPCFDVIWSAATTFVRLRTEHVVVVRDAARREKFIDIIGKDCLWKGFGGKSEMPLGSSAADAALSKLSQVSDAELGNPEIARLTPEIENFPPPALIAVLKQGTAANSTAVAADSLASVSP